MPEVCPEGAALRGDWHDDEVRALWLAGSYGKRSNGSVGVVSLNAGHLLI